MHNNNPNKNDLILILLTFSLSWRRSKMISARQDIFRTRFAWQIWRIEVLRNTISSESISCQHFTWSSWSYPVFVKFFLSGACSMTNQRSILCGRRHSETKPLLLLYITTKFTQYLFSHIDSYLIYSCRRNHHQIVTISILLFNFTIQIFDLFIPFKLQLFTIVVLAHSSKFIQTFSCMSLWSLF